MLETYISQVKSCDVMLFFRQLIPGSLHALFEVDSTEHHFECLGFQCDLEFTVGEWARTAESAAFKTFCQNPNSGSVPVEEFDAVALAIEEDEYLSRERVFAQFVAHNDAESVEAFAQIARASGKADFDAVGQDHG